MYEVFAFCDLPTLLAAAAVSRAWRAEATADSTWARFDVCSVQDTYQHFCASQFSSLERQLWTSPESNWPRILWDANCDPSAIQKWSPYTQLLLVSGRYRYDIFEHQVTNRRVIELAINVPLTYQHYAGFEDRSLLLKSIKNRLPEPVLRQYFEPFDDDYEVQMAVASFHGEFYYEFTKGRRELLLAALAAAPTRPPACLARTKVEDMELLKATTQVWDYHHLYLDLSPALRNNPEAWQYCGPKLLESQALQERTYGPADLEMLLACYKRPLPCGWRPFEGQFSALSIELQSNPSCMLQLGAVNELFLSMATLEMQTAQFFAEAITRNPNAWYVARRVLRGEAYPILLPIAAKGSYLIYLEFERYLRRIGVKGDFPRRFASNRTADFRIMIDGVRADYGPCIYRNRIARTQAEHNDQQKQQPVQLVGAYGAEHTRFNTATRFDLTMPRANNLCTLPRHLFYKILGYTDLSPEQYLILARVCRYFYAVCTSDLAWNRFQLTAIYSPWSTEEGKNSYREYLIERQSYREDERMIQLHRPVEAVNSRPKGFHKVKALVQFTADSADVVVVRRDYKTRFGVVPGELRCNYDSRLLFSDEGRSPIDKVFAPHWRQILELLKARMDIDSEALREYSIINAEWTAVGDTCQGLARYGVAEPNLRYEERFALDFLRKIPQKLPAFLRSPIESRQVLIAAAQCRTKENVYELIDPPLRKDREFMREFFEADGWQIRYASEKEDHEMVVVAFKSFCNKKLLRNVRLRSPEIALAAISFSAQLYWEFEYRDDEFNKLAMAANCTLWDTLQSAELAPIASAQDYRCWQEVSKSYEVPEPRVRRLAGYRRQEMEPLKRRRILVLIEDQWHDHCEMWQRYIRFAEYKVGLV